MNNHTRGMVFAMLTELRARDNNDGENPYEIHGEDELDGEARYWRVVTQHEVGIFDTRTCKTLDGGGTLNWVTRYFGNRSE